MEGGRRQGEGRDWRCDLSGCHGGCRVAVPGSRQPMLLPSLPLAPSPCGRAPSTNQSVLLEVMIQGLPRPGNLVRERPHFGGKLKTSLRGCTLKHSQD